MSLQMLTRTSRPALEGQVGARVGFFRRLFGTGQRRRRTYVPLTPDQY